VFNNLRGDVGEKLGLTYPHLKSVNPAIVCASLSAYGTQGEEAKWPGYDYLFQARAGWMSLTGGPEIYPMKSGLSLVDLSGAMMAALAMVSAVHQARETGIGGNVETSLYDTALSLLGYIGTWNMSRDWEPERLSHSAHPSVVPFQEFETADGHIVVACVKDKFFRELCDVMDLAELFETYPTMKDRQDHRDTVTRTLAERFLEENTIEWITRLRGRVPCEPVNSLSEALEGGAVAEKRGLLVQYTHPLLGEVRSLGTPIRGWWGDSVANERAPFLGEHTAEVLADNGYREDQIESFVASGVVAINNDVKE
jgi:crotonobetainyl-CoA:carnitine CoA-transferase CaiB-like acyl-CoA transferase